MNDMACYIVVQFGFNVHLTTKCSIVIIVRLVNFIIVVDALVSLPCRLSPEWFAPAQLNA